MGKGGSEFESRRIDFKLTDIQRMALILHDAPGLCELIRNQLDGRSRINLGEYDPDESDDAFLMATIGVPRVGRSLYVGGHVEDMRQLLNAAQQFLDTQAPVDADESMVEIAPSSELVQMIADIHNESPALFRMLELYVQNGWINATTVGIPLSVQPVFERLLGVDIWSLFDGSEQDSVRSQLAAGIKAYRASNANYDMGNIAGEPAKSPGNTLDKISEDRAAFVGLADSDPDVVLAILQHRNTSAIPLGRLSPDAMSTLQGLFGGNFDQTLPGSVWWEKIKLDYLQEVLDGIDIVGLRKSIRRSKAEVDKTTSLETYPSSISAQHGEINHDTQRVDCLTGMFRTNKAAFWAVEHGLRPDNQNEMNSASIDSSVQTNLVDAFGGQFGEGKWKGFDVNALRHALADHQVIGMINQDAKQTRDLNNSGQGSRGRGANGLSLEQVTGFELDNAETALAVKTALEQADVMGNDIRIEVAKALSYDTRKLLMRIFEADEVKALATGGPKHWYAITNANWHRAGLTLGVNELWLNAVAKTRTWDPDANPAAMNGIDDPDKIEAMRKHYLEWKGRKAAAESGRRPHRDDVRQRNDLRAQQNSQIEKTPAWVRERNAEHIADRNRRKLDDVKITSTGGLSGTTVSDKSGVPEMFEMFFDAQGTYQQVSPEVFQRVVEAKMARAQMRINAGWDKQSLQTVKNELLRTGRHDCASVLEANLLRHKLKLDPKDYGISGKMIVDKKAEQVAEPTAGAATLSSAEIKPAGIDARGWEEARVYLDHDAKKGSCHALFNSQSEAESAAKILGMGKAVNGTLYAPYGDYERLKAGLEEQFRKASTPQVLTTSSVESRPAITEQAELPRLDISIWTGIQYLTVGRGELTTTTIRFKSEQVALRVQSALGMGTVDGRDVFVEIRQRQSLEQAVVKQREVALSLSQSVAQESPARTKAARPASSQEQATDPKATTNNQRDAMFYSMVMQGLRGEGTFICDRDSFEARVLRAVVANLNNEFKVPGITWKVDDSDLIIFTTSRQSALFEQFERFLTQELNAQATAQSHESATAASPVSGVDQRASERQQRMDNHQDTTLCAMVTDGLANKNRFSCAAGSEVARAIKKAYQKATADFRLGLHVMEEGEDIVIESISGQIEQIEIFAAYLLEEITVLRLAGEK